MIFLTGATGFVGSHLADSLAERGFSLHCLVRSNSRLDYLPEGALTVNGDIADPAVAAIGLAGIRVFIHCASIINAPDGRDSTLLKANLAGTDNVLRWLGEQGKDLQQVVYVSSVGAMGTLTRWPVDESYQGKLLNAYQHSKRVSEERFKEFCARRGLKLVIVRPSWVYGPRDRRVLAFIRAIHKGRFAIIGSGKTSIHPVYVKDLVSGIVQSLDYQGREHTFILAGPKTYPLQEVVQVIAALLERRAPGVRLPYRPMYAAAWLCEMLCKPLGIKPFLFRRRLDFFSQNQAFSIQRARREFGYQPACDLRQGMAQTIGWYKQAGWL